jgi:hypothetical protein
MIFETIEGAADQVPQTDYLTTIYREDLEIWICRWSDFTDSRHLRQLYEDIFDQAIRQNYQYWLIDIRSRPRAQQADHDWYFNQFLPAKVGNLPGNNYLAYLVTPSHFSYIAEIESLTKLEAFGRISTLHTRFCQSEQDAFDWLTAARALEENS